MVLECISETSLHVFVKVVTENTALLPSTQSWDSFCIMWSHIIKDPLSHTLYDLLKVVQNWKISCSPLFC